jgi:hypothetical protein
MVLQETRGRNGGAALATAAGMFLGVGTSKRHLLAGALLHDGVREGWEHVRQMEVGINNDCAGENWCCASLVASQGAS